MGIRIHPNRCDKDFGTCIIKLVVNRFAEAGITSIRLDVAGSNIRAIWCYEKMGFVVIKEFGHDSIPLHWMDLKTKKSPLN